MAGKRKTRNKPFVHIEINRHGNRVVYFRRGKGERIRLPDDVNSTEFEASYQAALNDTPIPHVRDALLTPVEERKQRVEAALKKNLIGARARAKTKKRTCSIDLDWLLDRVETNNFCCELTGIEFYSRSFGVEHPRAFSPSIDRIDSSKGYEPNNVRIVLFAINVMLLDWGDRVFGIVSNAYAFQKKRVRRKSYSRT